MFYIFLFIHSPKHMISIRAKVILSQDVSNKHIKEIGKMYTCVVPYKDYRLYMKNIT